MHFLSRKNEIFYIHDSPSKCSGIYFGQVLLHCAIDRPFASYPKVLFQSEARCSPIDLKMIFILMQIKLIFTSFALNLVLKTRVFRSWKWPIFQHFKK